MIEGERAALPFVHISLQNNQKDDTFRSEALNGAADCEQTLQQQFVLFLLLTPSSCLIPNVQSISGLSSRRTEQPLVETRCCAKTAVTAKHMTNGFSINEGKCS